MKHTGSSASSEKGVLLVAESIVMPRSVLLSTEFWSKDWRRILNFTPAALEVEVLKAGWNFFLLAGPIHTSVYGYDRGESIHTAVARALRLLTQAGLNCLQIEHITRDTYLGAPRLKLEASRRHIGRSHDCPATGSMQPPAIY